MEYLGDFLADETVYFTFTTNDGSGGAVAPSSAFEAADLKIYKDGAAFAPNGVSMTSPFDAITGLHAVAIDTSNDGGDNWITGADYSVVLSPDETVDGQTVVRVVASFSIQNRYMRGTDSAALATGVDLTHIMGTILTEGVGGRLAAAFIKLLDVVAPVLTAESVNQGANNNTILAHADYGNAKLVRATTPANKLDVSASGEVGLDFNNIKDATGTHTLTNITVPTTTDVTNRVTANTDQIEGGDATDAITASVPTVNAIRDGILDDATRFSGANIDAAISGANTTTPPTVNEVRDGILDDATRFSGGKIDATITSRAPAAEYDTQMGRIDTTVSSRGTADPGDAMTLEADAIKSTSYDETSAWPIKAADAGATQIARVGADGDTLETLSDQIDGTAPANEYNTEMARITANVATETKQDTAQSDITAIKDKTDNQPAGVPKNVALSNFEFLMLDSSDNITPKTGETVTTQLSKDGGSFAGSSNSASEVGSGVYKINLTQAEMNADVITLKFTSSGANQRTVTIVTSA